MKIDIDKLAEFLVKAKKSTYASLTNKEVSPERPLHKELEFQDGELYYLDSYIGFFQAPGMEEVRLGKSGETIWTMAYSGGMIKKFHGNLEMAKLTFNFLKEALSKVKKKFPFRGPKKLEKNDWKYINKIKGDIIRFEGYEKILFKDEEVFNQNYIGGLVIIK